MEFATAISAIKSITSLSKDLKELIPSKRDRETRANDFAIHINNQCKIICDNYIKIIGSLSFENQNKRYKDRWSLSADVDTLRKEREEFLALRIEAKAVVSALLDDKAIFFRRVKKEAAFRNLLICVQELFIFNNKYWVGNALAGVTGDSSTVYLTKLYDALRYYGEGMLGEPEFGNTARQVHEDIQEKWYKISEAYVKFQIA